MYPSTDKSLFPLLFLLLYWNLSSLYPSGTKVPLVEARAAGLSLWELEGEELQCPSAHCATDLLKLPLSQLVSESHLKPKLTVHFPSMGLSLRVPFLYVHSVFLSEDFGVWKPWVWIPTSSIILLIDFATFIDPSETQFPHLGKEIIIPISGCSVRIWDWVNQPGAFRYSSVSLSQPIWSNDLFFPRGNPLTPHHQKWFCDDFPFIFFSQEISLYIFLHLRLNYNSADSQFWIISKLCQQFIPLTQTHNMNVKQKFFCSLSHKCA